MNRNFASHIRGEDKRIAADMTRETKRMASAIQQAERMR